MSSLDHILSVISSLTAPAGFDIRDIVTRDGRDARRCPPPPGLDGAVTAALAGLFPDGIYTHQAEAIATSLSGEDICLATATASGKSLAFMSVAAHHLQIDPAATVLAVYPTRALISDQLGKWQDLLRLVGGEAAIIDGGVPMKERIAHMQRCRVLLMTPDVIHAWLLSHLGDTTVARFLDGLRLLVVDEAHAYGGVFGTNAACLFRRIAAASPGFRLIASTATVAEPQAHIEALTGRSCRVFGEDDDGAARPERAIVLATQQRKGALTSFLHYLTRDGTLRFLVFADSRKQVEQIVAQLHQEAGEEQILPYRSGYEDEDRKRIEGALRDGTLRGVVSTSALELGLDIGELDAVVLAGLPPSMKSFWQRAGRVGRRAPGVCLIVDSGRFSDVAEDLPAYLARPVEPAWLYLENRFILYIHALCIAAEIAVQPGLAWRAPAATLPPAFARFVEEELSPHEAIPPELYPIKQLACDDPHHRFPLRGEGEPDFEIVTPTKTSLGRVTNAQRLREAYPGAVYLYMAQPFRISRIDRKAQQIHAHKAKHIHTSPISQSMGFPDISGAFRLRQACLQVWAEGPLQVSERVAGFYEHHGEKLVPHAYGAGSRWSQKPLTRYVETSGVYWSLGNEATNQRIAERIADTFALRCGVQRAELGVGRVHAKETPWGPISGVCVYDATHGSLRLTSRLADDFAGIARAAARIEKDDILRAGLLALAAAVESTPEAAIPAVAASPAAGKSPGSSVIPMIAVGESAMWFDHGSCDMVTIKGYQYTPEGLFYDISTNSAVRHWAQESTIRSLAGQTRIVRIDLLSGKEIA